MQIISAMKFSAENIRPQAARQGNTGTGTGFDAILAQNRATGVNQAARYQGTAVSRPIMGDNVRGAVEAIKAMVAEVETEAEAVVPAVAGNDDDGLEDAMQCVAAVMQAQPAGQTEVLDQQILEECNKLLDTVVDVLEGNIQDPNMDIDGLVAKVEELLGQLEVPLEENPSAFAKEFMARMPAIEEMRGPVEDQLPDGMPYPLENVNDKPAEEAGPILATQPKETAVKAEDSAPAAKAPETPEAPSQAAPAQQGQGGADTGTQPGDEEAVEVPAQNEARAAAAPAEDKETARGLEKEEAKAEEPTDQTAAASAKPVDMAPLRAEASARGVEAPRQVAATQETLMDTMVQEISLDSIDGKSSVEIQLRPDFLGKVSIQLTMDENGLQAKIRAEDPGVKSLIGSQINQLIESLEQKGIRTHTIDVVYTGTQAGGFDQGGGRGGESMAQEGRNKPLAAKAIGGSRGGVQLSELEVEAADAVLDPEISSVEYRA